MQQVHIKEAVGMVLGHDMTEIIPGKSKGPAFKKGHIIKEEDISRLLNMGKEHIYIMEFRENDVHENEAAIRIAEAVAGNNITFSEPSEGKVNLIATQSGLLKINYKALMNINSLDEIMVATLNGNQVINKNTVIAGTRIIPLVTESKNIEALEQVARENYPVIEILPLRKLKIGIVTTGSEVYYKRIKDEFGPVIKEKFKELGCEVINQLFSKDDSDMIAQCINTLIEEGAEMITVTGGMSVDPDDVTPAGIKKSGAHIVSYGAPTLPGAMFLLSYLKDVPVLGLPGCVMYNKRTIFDLVVPRLVAGEKVTKEDIIRLGHGGLCLGCKICTYPNCGFGKGGLY